VQTRQLNKGNNTSAMTVMTTMQREGKEKRGQQDNDNYASATRGTMLVQCWQWCQRNKGDDTIVTTAKAPAHLRWQSCHCDEGNNTSLTMAMTA
jgi:hypothetical protein